MIATTMKKIQIEINNKDLFSKPIFPEILNKITDTMATTDASSKHKG